ncbi:MAG: penicillin-insensitive murein endopeptidase, partial [Candidatus Binatia bacterium]
LVALAIVAAFATSEAAEKKRAARSAKRATAAKAAKGKVPSWTHATRWASVKDPKAATPRVIGGYASGCVQGAEELPDVGPGFELLHRSRHRQFGHPDLVDFVRRLAGAATARKLPALLVGDLGQARGGPTPTDHGSHQSGLDVDVSFTRPRDALDRPLAPDVRDKLSFPVVFDLRTAAFTGDWNLPSARTLLELAATDAAVDRIFVNASIKRALCESGRAPWMQTVRPWWNHHDHFHVRLKCPAGNQSCKGQPALPAGDGCGKELAWWFSPAMSAPRKPSKKPARPKLPAECRALLR